VILYFNQKDQSSSPIEEKTGKTAHLEPIPVSTIEKGKFTVREYHIYQEILATPAEVSEEEAAKKIGQKYGITPKEALSISRKVQEELFIKKWMSTPESEIRHASDWNKSQ